MWPSASIHKARSSRFTRPRRRSSGDADEAERAPDRTALHSGSKTAACRDRRAARGGLVDAAIRARDPRFVYYGRVVRHAGWTVCHYLFFYAMNDWRSSFAGANDHEEVTPEASVFVKINGSCPGRTGGLNAWPKAT